jgi:4-hydroxybenzoate polyprenyltransferase
LLLLIPLSGLIAIGLHFANALPDIGGDQLAGRRSLPVLVGVYRSRWAASTALAVAGVLAVLVAAPLGQYGPVFFTGLGVLALGLFTVVATRTQRPFPVLAVSTAIFAIAWLASLPRT